MVSTYRAINHEPEQVLDVVICHDGAIGALPHALPIGVALFDCCADPVDELWVCDGDLEVGVLDVSLEAVYVLPHCQDDRMDHLLVHGELRFEICPVFRAVIGGKGHGRGNIEVMFEVFDVQENRVAVVGDAKKLHCGLAASNRAFLGLD